MKMLIKENPKSWNGLTPDEVDAENMKICEGEKSRGKPIVNQIKSDINDAVQEGVNFTNSHTALY